MRVLFQDEARFGRISDHRRCWAPLPERPISGQQVIREYTYAFAAVSPEDGRLSSLVLPWVDANTMSIFLAHTAVEFAGDYCIMILDGAGWHHAHDVRIPPRMRLVFLPPYSPELNPAEMLWEHVRENYFGNRVFSSLDQVAAQLCHALRSMDGQPETIRSMTAFDWIKTLPLTAV